MKRLNLWAMAIGMLLAGCGGLTDGKYFGEPLATIHGTVKIAPGDRPNDTLQALLMWAVQNSDAYLYQQNIDVGGATFGTYSIDLFTPPPDAFLNIDPQTGGKIGFANIYAYDDPRGEGPVDLSKVKPEDYKKLLYRLRGGSETIMLAYAKDRFPAGSQVATALGRAVEPGFFLVRFDGDCYCYFNESCCHDSLDQCCSGRFNSMTILPMDTEVTLNIVNDSSEYRNRKAPDWLFF